MNPLDISSFDPEGSTPLLGKRFEEIVVSILPLISRGGARDRQEAQQDERTVYDVLVYSHTPLPKLDPPELGSSSAARMFRSLPLAGTGRIRMNWRDYDRYYEWFLDGDKSLHEMGNRLRQALSPGLHELIDGKLTPRPQRLWWATDVTELNWLPWEAAVQAGGKTAMMMRGLPSMDGLIVPVSGALRLAIVSEASEPSAYLRQLIENFSKAPPPSAPAEKVKIIPYFGKPLRDVIRQVAREGIELMHIETDGLVSLAREGLLCTKLSSPHEHAESETSGCRGGSRGHLSGRELASMLSGSRVTMLSFSCPSDTAETVRGAYQTSAPQSQSVGSSFRAFAAIASESRLKASVLIPLGPMPIHFVTDTVARFYTRLASTYNLDEAVIYGLGSGFGALALYPRQLRSRLFRHVSTTVHAPGDPAIEANPQQLEAELNSWTQLTSDFESLRSNLGELPGEVQEFLSKHQEYRQNLQDRLRPWSEGGEE